MLDYILSRPESTTMLKKQTNQPWVEEFKLSEREREKSVETGQNEPSY